MPRYQKPRCYRPNTFEKDSNFSAYYIHSLRLSFWLSYELPNSHWEVNQLCSKKAPLKQSVPNFKPKSKYFESDFQYSHCKWYIWSLSPNFVAAAKDCWLTSSPPHEVKIKPDLSDAVAPAWDVHVWVWVDIALSGNKKMILWKP